MWRRLIDNEKGSTFMLVMVGFFVLFMLTTALLFTGDASTKHVIKEEQRTKAYYVAKTGAESYINHLEKEIEKGKDIITDLDDLHGKTSKPTKFGDGEFNIKIEKFVAGQDADGNDIHKYRVITTGTVKEEDSVINAIISPQFDGGGYNNGDGKIFVNKTGQIQIPTVPQLTGAGVSIYSLDKKYDGKVPIHINDPGKINEIFRSLNDRGKSIVKDLNDQERSNYRLEITEPTDLNSKISKNNPIKIEKLTKYKGSAKDPDFEEIEFRYDTEKKDVLSYFSKGKLFDSGMTDIEIEQGLKSTFLIPIDSVQDYKDYTSGTAVYPPSPAYNIPAGSANKGSIVIAGDADNKDDRTLDLDLRSHKNIEIDKIVVDNAGELNIKASDGTKIFINGGITTNDAKPIMNKINIETDGKVDFYIKGSIDFDGNMIVSGSNAEVNFYMYGGSFQINNKAIVKNVNLYAPNTNVQLQNNINYQGVIVTGGFEMNDNSTFEAPSSGPASTGSQISSKIDIEWER